MEYNKNLNNLSITPGDKMMKDAKESQLIGTAQPSSAWKSKNETVEWEGPKTDMGSLGGMNKAGKN